MAAKIIKIQQIKYPKLRLIGKKYSNSDRVNGNFGHLWQEWHQKGYFNIIQKLSVIAESEGAFLGVMRIVNDIFEYWIGQFCSIDSQVPEGFDYIDIEEFKVANCWIYGNSNNGEIYGLEVHNRCLQEISNLGMMRKDDAWCIEKYTCPRFTTPDEKGNVILDYEIEIY